VPARGEPARRSRAPGRRAGLHGGRLGIRNRAGVLEAWRQREQELPYNPIIALNAGGAVLHYQVLEKRPPRERHSLLIDAGAEFAGYASDITRTHSYQDADFAALIGRLDQMQQALCAGVRAGVDWRDVHLNATSSPGTGCARRTSPAAGADEAVATAVTSVFLPHGIGICSGSRCTTSGASCARPKAGTSRVPTATLT